MISKLETRPNYVGYVVEDGVEKPVEADFRLLLADIGDGGKMRQIGYLWDNRNVTFISHLDQETIERVKQLVTEQLGVEVDRVGNPPAIVDELYEDTDD